MSLTILASLSNERKKLDQEIEHYKAWMDK
jgi:hypothetical protein